MSNPGNNFESGDQIDLSDLLLPTDKDELSAFLSSQITEEELRAKLKRVIQLIGAESEASTIINGVPAQTNRIIVAFILAHILKFKLFNELLFRKYPELKPVFILDFQIRATADPEKSRYIERAKTVTALLAQLQIPEERLQGFYSESVYLKGEGWRNIKQILLDAQAKDLFTNVVESYLNQVIATIHKYYYDMTGGTI